MDNLDEKLEITNKTTKDEIIGYAISLWDKHKPKDLTKEEVIKYAGSTWEHSKSVQFYLNKLDVSIEDGEMPHDLIGPGNKLEWEVMHGLAYAEKDTPKKKKIFEESLKRHRIQRHHRMWNREDNNWTDKDMKYGAIDSVCSLLEPRLYQNGVHYWDEILNVISPHSNKEHKKENPRDKYKKEYMKWAVEEMQKVTPLLKDLKIMIASFLQGDKKNSKENNNNSN